MSDHFSLTIEAVIKQIDDLERDVADKKRTVNDLCKLAGRPPVYASATPAAQGMGSLTKDAFYGKKLATAVREVLERRKVAGLGAAMPIEIYDALVQGGFHFETKNEDNAKRGLYQSLTKNSTTFHKLPNGTYGLREWYPAIKSRGAAGQAESGVAVAEDADEDDAVALDGAGGFTDTAKLKPR
jgi:hypothetical protein